MGNSLKPQNKMKTLKHQSKGTIAVVTEKTTYLAMLDGTIIKQFPTSTFNDINYKEEIEFPVDFEEAKKEFNKREAEKRVKRERQMTEQLRMQREKRRQEIIDLWNWRKGRTEAYIIANYVRIADENSSSNPTGYTTQLVIGEDKARNLFSEISGSETPYWDGKENNCYFITELMTNYREIKEEERLEITTLEELEQFIKDIAETVEYDEYAPSIEDKDYIVTFGRRFGRTSTDIVESVEERRTLSGWIGSSYYNAQTTTADLDFDQAALTIDELWEKYPEEAERLEIEL